MNVIVNLLSFVEINIMVITERSLKSPKITIKANRRVLEMTITVISS